MDWIYLLLLILLSPAGFYVGWRYVGPMTSRWWIVITTLSLAITVLFVVFLLYPAIEYHFIPLLLSDFAEIVRWSPFIMLFLGVAVKRAKGRFLPVELTLLALLFFIYGVLRVGWIYEDTKVDPSKFRITSDGVCLQSTGYTCAPASNVTLLRHYGIETTEVEMARLCHTGSGGTGMVAQARAIAKKVKSKGLQADIISVDWDTLKQFKPPFIVNIKCNPLVDHVIVVLSIEGNKVIVGDPLLGKWEYTESEFLNKWRGSVIVVR